MRGPKHLFSEWEEIQRAARRARRVFLFFDFDGTLASIRRRPEDVHLSAELQRLLAGIGREGVIVAIISGRGLGDVCRRAAVRNIWYAGAHGYFLRAPHGGTTSLLSSADRKQVERALRFLRAELRRIPGIQLESKEATIAVHYRRAGGTAQTRAFKAVRQAVKRYSFLKVMHGKKVWEILPSARIDKWTAARAILARQRWSASRDLLFYFGDDTTDEAVFRGMKGISVVVGKQSRTAARYFVRSPADVKRFLRRWKAGRSGSV